MALEKSVLDKNSIGIILKNEYGLTIYDIKKIDRGSANIYKIYTSLGNFLLKEFQEDMNFDRINNEFLITQKLKNTIPVPEFVLTKDEKICTIYKNKFLILQKFIEGKVNNSNSSSKTEILDSANFFGIIIQELQKLDYELPSFERHILTEKKYDDYINKIDMLLTKTSDNSIKSALLHKKKILERINGENLSWQNKITCENSHGDYTIFQFIYNDGNEIAGIIDWVSARKMPIARELIRNYFFMAKEIKQQKIDIDFFIKYINEFCKYKELNCYDLKYMPLLYLIELSSTTYGYDQYINTGNKKLLDYGNELYNHCLCLENNLNDISSALVTMYKERVKKYELF